MKRDRVHRQCRPVSPAWIAVLLWVPSLGPLSLAAGEQNTIPVLNAKRLPAEPIPVERVPLGKPDDYKPCIAQLPSGELLLTAFHQHKRDGNKVMEQTLLFRSKDGGKTWSNADELDLLGREPYLTVLKDGTVFITGHLLAQDVRNPWGYTCGFLHRSTDGGRSWESIRVESEGIKPTASNHTTRNVLQRADGTLLLGVDYDGGGGPYLMWRSLDGGKTWDKTGKCQPKDFQSKYGFFGGETWLWQAKSGKIWALVRVDSSELPIQDRPIQAKNDQADHFILFSSADEGNSFDRIRDLGDYGEMYMSLVRLQDQRLLLTFTVRDLKPPLGVRALVGMETDDGFEFDFSMDRIMLDTRTPVGKNQGGGFGPTVQLKDGTLVTSYSYRGEDDKTHLEVVRWRLPASKVGAVTGHDLNRVEPLDIGVRRELFVDDWLVERLEGKAELRLQRPTPADVVLVHDDPWEGNASAYHSVFRDGDRYRMFYRAWHLGSSGNQLVPSRENLCYAESDDGIIWRKPRLGLVEFNGSKENNIVLSTDMAQSMNLRVGGPAVFRDENSNAPAEARYKTLMTSHEPLGLVPLGSADGLHWKPLTPAPTITAGAFDSQNLMFWDGARGEYRAYWRIFTAGTTTAKVWKPDGIRAIRTAVSKDLVHWTGQADLVYPGSPPEQMYENGVAPCPRAPHIFIGFPVRYIDRANPGGASTDEPGVTPEQLEQWPPSLKALPDFAIRAAKAGLVQRFGAALTEGQFMASRDGVTFKRWNEGFLRPGPERSGTWNYGHQFIAWHPVETAATIPGAPRELSLYATEAYWSGSKGTSLRRYTLRQDGFVALSAPYAGGELRTKPLKFDGDRLSVNFATSAAGHVRVELLDAQGRPIDGFTRDDCDELFGDTLDRLVSWRGRTDLSTLKGHVVRVTFILRDADLYSFQFRWDNP